MHAMRFHEYGGPECLLDDVVDRPTPAEDEVLVELAAASVNSVDWQLGAGYGRGRFDLALPFTPGVDFAGVVREVGSSARGFASGDRVFGAQWVDRCGTYAEYVAVPAAIVEHVPDNLLLHVAAAVPLAALTAWEAVHGNVRAGQRVLVQGGAGGTGTFALQFAKQHGAHVIATGSAGNHGLLRSLGADEVVDYRAARFEDVIEPVDAVINLVGGDVTLRSIPLVRGGGALISIVPTPDTVAECEAAARRHGIRLGFVNMRIHRGDTAFADITQLLASEALKVVVSESYPLAQAPEALARSRAGHVRGKIVLTIGPPG